MQAKDLNKSIALELFINTYSKNLKITDEGKFEYWKNNIVPSCCFQKEGSYSCIFCHNNTKYAYNLRRHYHEKHFDLIPEGIFGSIQNYTCHKCYQTFSRKFSLKKHVLNCSHHSNNILNKESLNNIKQMENNITDEKNLFNQMLRSTLKKKILASFLSTKKLTKNKEDDA
jgi:hypothetical protein